MDKALGELTPPPSPHVDLPTEQWFPEEVEILIWNIKFNDPPEVENPTQATKGIVAATLVIEHPPVVFLQEVGWAPMAGSRASPRTWIQTHLIGTNKVGDKCDRLPFPVQWKEEGKRVLENYGFCTVQGSFDHTTEQEVVDTFEASGAPHDVYIMYRKELLQVIEAKVRDKSLMQHFSEALLDEFKAIMRRFPKDYEAPETRTEHIGRLAPALESTFKKILGQAVCAMLQSNRPRSGQSQVVTFLAMSVHMPYRGKNIERFGQATLKAACSLARTMRLSLFIGGDWNVAVSMVHDAVPNLCLLSGHKRIDGVFMYEEPPVRDESDDYIPFLAGHGTPSYAHYSSYEPYKWQQAKATLSEASDNGGDAAALAQQHSIFAKFANSCYNYKSNHMPILVKLPSYGTLHRDDEEDEQIVVRFLR